MKRAHKTMAEQTTIQDEMESPKSQKVRRENWMTAMRDPNIESLSLLIETDDINAFDSNGDSPFIKVMMYCEKENVSRMLSFLLDKGVDINAPVNTSGSTPLLWVAGSLQQSSILDLINRGADHTAVTMDGNSLLHLLMMKVAGNFFDIKTVETYIVNHGPNINAPNKLGETPLHIAAHYSNVEGITVLLKHHASLTALDSNRQTPLMRAQSNNFLRQEETTQLLLTSSPA